VIATAVTLFYAQNLLISLSRAGRTLLNKTKSKVLGSPMVVDS